MKKRSNEYAYRDRLPFVNPKESGSSFWWSVKPSGDYERDFATGREYALQFWKVCGKHASMGLDLSTILIALHKLKRPQHRYVTGKLADHNLSGIEIGFLRTVGDLLQASMYATVMVGIGTERLAKRDFLRREGLQKMKAAAGLIGVLAEATHRSNVVPSAVN
jgi:hypothetical protein